jgi:hypothetical protein
MKKVFSILSLFGLIIFGSSFSDDDNTSKKAFDFTANSNYAAISNVPSQQEVINQDVEIPFVGNRFNGFREALGFKESQGKYHAVNTLGYLGKYQFGESTLNRFKIYDIDLFLNTPELQENAFVALCSLNKWILKRDIERSVGKKINGIRITESGILAAAHLAGAGNVKKFLRSGGENQFSDAYGSSVQHYLKEFAGYDTSFIKPKKKPIVS